MAGHARRTLMGKASRICCASLGLLLLLSACGEGPRGVVEAKKADGLTKVRTDRTYFRDEQGRYVFFHGVNLGCDTKVPAEDPEDKTAVSYIGKPFPLEEADRWFGKLRDLGFNSVRFIMNWDAIEHAGPGKYDTEYLDFVEALVKKAHEYGIYCLMDMHQDIFSRYLHVNFSSHPKHGEPGSLEWMLFSLLPHTEDGEPNFAKGSFDNRVQGHGAPEWVVRRCLPHKNLDSPYWGVFRALGGIIKNQEAIRRLVDVLMPSEDGGEDWTDDFVKGLPPPFEPTQSSDFMPWGMWGINMGFSVDMERCVSAFFGGDKVWPAWRVDEDGWPIEDAKKDEGEGIQSYMQRHYVDSWMQVVERVKDEPNVIGYDLMNEPPGLFIALLVDALYFEGKLDETLKQTIKDLFPDTPAGSDKTIGEDLVDVIFGLSLLPFDSSDEEKKKRGMDGVDAMSLLDINFRFDELFLQPFYEKVGSAIVEKDPSAVLWIERGAGLSLIQGPGGFQPYESFMTWPKDPRTGERFEQVVYAPHWYPDIYPEIGFNVQPRTKHVDQVKHQSFSDKVREGIEWSHYALSNAPVVFGEFGTYFNYNVPRLRGLTEDDLKAQMKEKSYPVAAEILDNYYEAFEEHNLPHMQWCFSANADYFYGELWNNEDFSVIDPDGEPRADTAYSRPYARALSGKPKRVRFFSEHHYFDPDKGKPDPRGEMVLEMESKETDAPTEVFVPARQYPEGFYVWLSDGYASFDSERRLLLWFPTADEPDAVHSLRLRPPLEGDAPEAWTYFVDAEGRTIDGAAPGL